MGLYKNNNGTLELISGATVFADSPIGTIQAYGGPIDASHNPPEGWLLCDGRAVSRTTYAALFAVIGTSYGNGDGTTTFNLPNPRNKFLEGASSTNVLGSEKSAGLPNIKGNVNLRSGPSQYPTITNFNNAFKNSVSKDTSTSQFTTFAVQEGSNSYKDTIKLNAHDYNAIYSDDVSTVQPPAVCVNYIIKAEQVAIPADFVEAAADAGEAAAEEVVALKQNITDNSLNTISKTIPGAINEVAGHAKLIDGDANYTWIDIPADKSTSGKMTRAFIHDQDLFMGTQIWTNGSLTKEGKFFFRPTPTQITFLNGVTSDEPANCNIIDFGAFIAVNLTNVTIPNDFTQHNYFMQLPAFATARINFVVPTSSGYEIVYIDANTRELRITNKVTQQIFTNMIIPVDPARY